MDEKRVFLLRKAAMREWTLQLDKQHKESKDVPLAEYDTRSILDLRSVTNNYGV